MSGPRKLRIEPVTSERHEPQQWYAAVANEAGSVDYDAVGDTIELALAGLIQELCQALEDQ